MLTVAHSHFLFLALLWFFAFATTEMTPIGSSTRALIENILNWSFSGRLSEISDLAFQRSSCIAKTELRVIIMKAPSDEGDDAR